MYEKCFKLVIFIFRTIEKDSVLITSIAVKSSFRKYSFKINLADYLYL